MTAAVGDLDVCLADPQDRSNSVEALDVGNLLEGDAPLLCDIDDDAVGDVVTLFNSGGWRVPDADGEVPFGRDGDAPLCGDWGLPDDSAVVRDTFAVRRGNQYFLSEAPAVFTDGRAATSFRFGRTTDQSLVGDWDGDGVDEIALLRGNVFFFASENVDGGGTVTSSAYGRASDLAVAGDFAGQDYDTVAVRRGNVFHGTDEQPGSRLRTSLTFTYGRVPTDLPVAGTPFRGEPGFLGVVRVER